MKKLLFLILALTALASTAYATSEPTAQSKASIDAVIAILRDSSVDKQAQREQISTIIGERFDFQGMSQRVLAKNWKKATGPEKEQFVELFGKLLINTYLGRIEAYTDEKVEFVKEKIKGEKYALIDTRIVTSSKEIPVNYKMKLHGDQWLVYDVVIEAVSLISNYRNTYAEIFKSKGMKGLLKQMEDKVAETSSQ